MESSDISQEYSDKLKEKAAKQEFLKTEIVDKGFNKDEFAIFLD